MAIPNVHQMLRPLLALANEGPITRRDSTPIIGDYFHLTPEEREARIPSGGATTVRHRVGWAFTFLTKAGLVEKVAPITYRATERGRAFLLEHPKEITRKDLEAIPGWKEVWQTAKTDKGSAEVVPAPGEETPIEALDGAIATLNADLKNRLLQTILEQTPTTTR